MHYFITLALILLFGFTQPNHTVVKTKVAGKIMKDSLIAATTDTVFLKDINNDKIADTAFVYTPPTFASYTETGELDYQFGCPDNNCYNKITFSCALPELMYDDCVWGWLESAGDLDHDGIAELLFSPGWFTSSMSHLILYSLKDNKWVEITKVDIRLGDDLLKSHLIKKGKRYFLRGTNFYDDDKPYQVQVKFNK